MKTYRSALEDIHVLDGRYERIVRNHVTKKHPIMLHRVCFGSIERFIGIPIEHFAGKFPV